MKPRFESLLVALCLTLASCPSVLAQPGDPGCTVFVQSGVAKDVVVVGKKWQQAEGFLECSGIHNYLYAGKALGSGDVHVRARLALLNIAGSAASVDIDTRDHFGFDGGGKQGMFVSGPLFGKLRFIGPYSDFIEEAKPFELEVVREGSQLRVLIDGKEAYQCTDRRAMFGAIALRPWRATMRVYDFSASGGLEKLVIPADIGLGIEKPFTIPAIDLSGETERHVIVAQGTSTSYKGHPTTLLMPDEKTMFCVYPLGHGGPNAVLRRSDDGGLTWGPQRRIAQANEEYPGAWPCEPAFVRSPDGDEIACLMRENSRRYMSMVMFSRDEGETWTEMRGLPRALTGDRHQPRYAPDGRLVIPFRDTAPGSPTRSHFVAWVGTYDDIAKGRSGQYRVKLLHSHAGSDCGYPGLELLPDGTFVATTYVKYRPGPEKQSVVSARSKLCEIDAMAEAAQSPNAETVSRKDIP